MSKRMKQSMIMNKKQREKYINELAADPNPTLEDLLGIIGWDINYTPEEKAETDRLTAEWIRKDREKNKQEIEKITERMNSNFNANVSF